MERGRGEVTRSISRLIPAAYENNWTSAVGALAGVLHALGSAQPETEISARGGHAFRIAITSTADGEIGADGPNHFSTRVALSLYENLGWRFESIEAAAGAAQFDRRRDEALKQIRKSIDRGRPVMLFGLHLPEWGIVHGYDRDDLIASTTMSSQYSERIPASQWPAPGRPLPVRVILPEKRGKIEPARALRRLVEFVLDYAWNGEPDMTAGLGPAATGLVAYDRWTEVLESEAAISPHGHAYCIQVLQSARHDAAAFLRTVAPADDARSTPFVQAANAYAGVVLELSRMATLFPYPNGGDVVSAGSRRAGAACVRRARAAEEQAIASLGLAAEALAR